MYVALQLASEAGLKNSFSFVQHAHLKALLVVLSSWWKAGLHPWEDAMLSTQQWCSACVRCTHASGKKCPNLKSILCACCYENMKSEWLSNNPAPREISTEPLTPVVGVLSRQLRSCTCDTDMHTCGQCKTRGITIR